MEKQEIRQIYLAKRLAVENKTEKSQSIMNKIIAMPSFRKAKTIAVYASLPFEVDTQRLIIEAWAQHKRVVFPKVEGSDMSFYQVTSFEELFPNGPFGIREPTSSPKRLVKKTEIDLIIVPGICFDQKKYRVGYGKGFYDRYLKGCPAYKIGVCFEEQRYAGNIPVSAYDVAMDLVVSA